MRDYMIYKLENSKTAEEMFSFFLPERGNEKENSFKRKCKRLLQLKDLKSSGFVVTGILYVDKETYLNARLDEAVKEYCSLDKSEQEVKSHKSMYTKPTYQQTIGILHEQKWSQMKVIASLVRRLISEGYDVNNEIAILLYDRYLKF